MMKMIYYLQSCDTCRKMISLVRNIGDYRLQDIKSGPLSARQLDELKDLAGSYESLFSRRALKYKELNLKDQKLTEMDFRRLILEQYTFLKRPVIVSGEKIFAGSDKKNMESLEELLAGQQSGGGGE